MYKLNKFSFVKNMKNISLFSIPLTKLDRVQIDKKIMKPFEHLTNDASKHHINVPLAFNYWLKAPKEKVDAIEDILHSLHIASLLIDDVQDDTDFRYGVPTAHRVFSTGLTINTFTICLAIIIARKVKELDHPSALHIYQETLLECLRGQGTSLYWRDNFICPSEEEHMDMLKLKGGNSFLAGVQMLQLFSKTELDFSELAMRMGIYYSLVDDYCNLFNPKALMSFTKEDKQASTNYTLCTDITECRFSLPIIHALRYPDVADKICDILKQRTKDPSLKLECVEMLKKHGSDAYTRAVMQELEDDIHKEINELGGNPLLTSLINDLRFWKIDQKK